MTFEQLRYFVQTYQLRSISLASDSLHISRQVLSRSLSNLEKELNTSLFQRSVSGVIPTAAGKILYDSASKILLEQANALNKINALIFEKTQKPRIQIAIPNGFMKITGNDFSNRIASEYPDTFFNIKISQKKKNYKFYLDNEITIFSLDYSYKYKEKMTDRFTIEYLAKRPLYIWVAKNHPLANVSDSISLSLLKNYPFCLLKNSFNGDDFIVLLHSEANPYVDTEESFRGLIRDFSYFTIDCPFNNTFLFSYLFENNSDFVLKQTNENMYYYLVYRNDMKYNIVNYVKTYFKNII